MTNLPITPGIRPNATQFVRAAELALEHFPLTSGDGALVSAPLWQLAEIIAYALAEGAAGKPEIVFSHAFRERRTTVTFHDIPTGDVAALCALIQDFVDRAKEGAL